MVDLTAKAMTWKKNLVIHNPAQFMEVIVNGVHTDHALLPVEEERKQEFAHVLILPLLMVVEHVTIWVLLKKRRNVTLEHAP